ncbi:hypothetical protein V497_05966 [Pseudogymnoascus sp. VKM F-4516 (FW-969)]|nr:hypothetical protein V497_05966 [Pseudogymnoascus sp. VKM F-4516 (FW-969)]
MHALSTLLVVAAPVLVAAQNCPLQFDGRIPKAAKLGLLDTAKSPFNADYVKGAGLKWSEIAKFPKVSPPSLFDGSTYKAIEVTIDDASVFAPSADNVQIGFRRAELQPTSNTGSDPATTGIKTLHFSVRADTARPLNYTHEYQLAFLESADYSTNQFALKTGSIIDDSDPRGHLKKNWLRLVGNVNNDNGGKTLFEVPFGKDWHNFGLKLDFTKNTTQVFYSPSILPLFPVTPPIHNDISGQGQLHFGLLKKPIGENFTDMPHEGYQEPGIHEGAIFGGIFEEDSTHGCFYFYLIITWSSIMPHPIFYDGHLWRYDPDQLAKIAIRVAPTLTVLAICYGFMLVSYESDRNIVTHDNFAMADLQPPLDCGLADALKAAFLKEYNPLEYQILRITSIRSDDPSPNFKDIIRAHEISKPAFEGVIGIHEIRAITYRNAGKYETFMRRISSGPPGNRKLLAEVYSEALLNVLYTLTLEECERLSRFYAARSARFDLATAYKNHLGLTYPDCKNVSVCFGCFKRARESDPQEADEIEQRGFRALLSPGQHHLFRQHLQLVCDTQLFDDWIARMTSDMPSTMLYHVTYLAMAMFQCGFTVKQGKVAMTMCEELCEVLREIVLGLPLAGRVMRDRGVIRSLGDVFLVVDEFGIEVTDDEVLLLGYY